MGSQRLLMDIMEKCEWVLNKCSTGIVECPPFVREWYYKLEFCISYEIVYVGTVYVSFSTRGSLQKQGFPSLIMKRPLSRTFLVHFGVYLDLQSRQDVSISLRAIGPLGFLFFYATSHLDLLNCHSSLSFSSNLPGSLRFTPIFKPEP